MATPQQSQSTPYTRPAAAYTRTTVKTTTVRPAHNQTFLFDRSNYMWMFIGLGCILLGFFLMAGGKSANPHEFHYDEIYSFRRITLAPIIILLGFGIEVYAIMKKPAAVDETKVVVEKEVVA